MPHIVQEYGHMAGGAMLVLGITLTAYYGYRFNQTKSKATVDAVTNVSDTCGQKFVKVEEGTDCFTPDPKDTKSCAYALAVKATAGDMYIGSPSGNTVETIVKDQYYCNLAGGKMKVQSRSAYSTAIAIGVLISIVGVGAIVYRQQLLSQAPFQ